MNRTRAINMIDLIGIGNFALGAFGIAGFNALFTAHYTVALTLLALAGASAAMAEVARIRLEREIMSA